MTRLALPLALLLACGCDRSSAPPAPSPSASPSSAPFSSTAAASASASPTVQSSAPRSWRGSYKSAAATLAVPSAWSKVRWSADAATGIGAGTITLTVDPSGRASGTLDGALGAALVEGRVGDGRLTATIRRKDPSDQGFAGTLSGTVDAQHVEGTMSLSSADGSVQRSASFTLSPAQEP